MGTGRADVVQAGVSEKRREVRQALGILRQTQLLDQLAKHCRRVDLTQNDHAEDHLRTAQRRTGRLDAGLIQRLGEYPADAVATEHVLAGEHNGLDAWHFVRRLWDPEDVQRTVADGTARHGRWAAVRRLEVRAEMGPGVDLLVALEVGVPTPLFESGAEIEAEVMATLALLLRAAVAL